MKKDWIFVWHSKTTNEWNSINRNMNSIVDLNHVIDNAPVPDDLRKEVKERGLQLMKGYSDHFDLCVPPHEFDIPPFIKAIPGVQEQVSTFRGQILESFEEETFRYVLEKNTACEYTKDHLIIKEHLYPQEILTDKNSKSINFDKIAKYLETHSWVALGSFFDMKREENMDKHNILSSAFFYTRDKDTHAIRNLSGGRHPKGTKFISCINYMIFKKLKDENIVLCYLNPTLMAVPSRLENLDGNHRVTSLTYNKDIREFLTKPKIRIGTRVGNNIFADGSTVKIELCGEAEYKYLYRRNPILPYKIHTNLNHDIKNDVITLDVKKHGYIVIDYDIETFTRFDFDRRKAASHKIEFMLFKDS